MIGAIVGAIAGSRFEFCNLKAKEFTLLLSAKDDAEWGPRQGADVLAKASS